MLESLKTFYAVAGSMSGSSGFTNYTPGRPNDIRKALEEVWREFPDAVVVDGSDDWMAPIQRAPYRWQREFGIDQLADFHSGISGISRSGLVLTEEAYLKLRQAFQLRFGGAVESSVRVYRNE
jgi:hypothetical protein